jgi:hypothetical protein
MFKRKKVPTRFSIFLHKNVILGGGRLLGNFNISENNTINVEAAKVLQWHFCLILIFSIVRWPHRQSSTRGFSQILQHGREESRKH